MLNHDLYRTLPSVHQLIQDLSDPATPHELQVFAARQALEQGRKWITDHQESPSNAQLLMWLEGAIMARQRLSLRPVINATGVIIHTNLGRAPLSRATQEAMQSVAWQYSNLEYDLDAGKRGRRQSHIDAILTEITGAEAGMVVNNNAAAVNLVLNAFSKGREIIISRGQLVEIGGGFRIPDVMRQGGAQLVEVGTTNRTRASDYRNAITDNTFALMRIHSSNFRQIGFTEELSLADMVNIGREHGLAVVDDLGSGTFINTAAYGLAHEPMVQESVQAGADIIMFSGDKLLGGPQAGIIIGKGSYIDILKKHPLMRALRPDKTTFAGLARTLMHYRDGDALHHIPVWQMISMKLADIEARARNWQSIIGGEVLDGASTVGGGSLPGDVLPSRVLALAVAQPDAVVEALRHYDVPVIARIQEDTVQLDPRTVFPEQDDILCQALTAVLKGKR